ncbi:MAG: glycosyltransferase N-terminal domain-containing protein [Phycisphaeraceae bacterium]
MSVLYDIAYLTAGLAVAPVMAYKRLRYGKYRGDWAARFGRADLPAASGPAPGSPHRPTVLIHAVSVGEVNATRLLVERLRTRHADRIRIIISATTDTGIARARQLYSNGAAEVVRYPFDLSGAVRRFLDIVKPDAVALMELEIWPNFAAECKRRNIPLAVINGRLSERSFRGYRRFRGLLRSMFASLAAAAVQDAAYAERFAAMGTPVDRISVTGTMKWDTAVITDDVTGSDALADAMGIDRNKPLIVCGSTGPGEEALFVKHLVEKLPAGQMLMAPRKPERFDEAASAMGQPVRRTQCPDGTVRQPDDRRVFLLDTMGELRKAYTLADVVVVGRSFCPLFGSDMMEPIALGKPVVIGPNTGDFADTMNQLLAGDGILQVAAPGSRIGPSLTQAVGGLLANPARAAQLAENGRNVIRNNQGATDRHVQLIEKLLALQST